MTERSIEFEWDADKAGSNLKKHGVSFDEAEAAFNDDNALIFDDEAHSEYEPRQILISYSDRNRLLVIGFIHRAHNRIRLITARLATRKEHRDYEEKSRF